MGRSLNRPRLGKEKWSFQARDCTENGNKEICSEYLWKKRLAHENALKNWLERGIGRP